MPQQHAICRIKMCSVGGNLVLGVCGSISAYRACDLARELMRGGWDVRCCLTEGAERFVSRLLFETLTGNPCATNAFDEPEPGRMAHIDWARSADLLLIAPATANTINALAQGLARDMLTSLALACEGPIVLAPAMNPAMYAHPRTQESLRTLKGWATTIVNPQEGDVVSGEKGLGKLAPNAEILASVRSVATRSTLYEGKRVLITGGPTQEPIDDVRYIGNRSSGRMAIALARAALLMGAQVDLVLGPVALEPPRPANVVRVRTAREMLEAALPLAPNADLVIGAAAVADFTVERQKGKLRRADGLELHLSPTPDVIAELARVAKGKVIAFAAEPGECLDSARQKLRAKGVDAVAVNDISRMDIGFDSDENELTLVSEVGERRFGKAPKLACALWLLEQVAEL